MNTPSRISRERRCLQAAAAVAALVPVAAGLAGALLGIEPFGRNQPVHIDVASHGRYLSGLLLGLGLAFWSTIPRIEAHGPRFRLLAAIVFIGGLARLLGVAVDGVPSAGMVFGLAMELVATPALALWRERVERRWPP